MTTLVHQTGEPARIDDYADSSGLFADGRPGLGLPLGRRRADHASGGRLWGVDGRGRRSRSSLPVDTEARLAAFTELVGTAIANAEAQAALAASRARIVAAADDARRRIERDLHDGAQQRLVTLGLRLREVQATAPPGAGDLVERLDGVAAGLEAALAELREIARGIHPAVLAEGGLRPALATLARRCPVPVELRVQVAGPAAGTGRDRRLLRGLRGADQHRQARPRHRRRGRGGRRARACCGSASATTGAAARTSASGSGLVGLRDRVEALGGRITLRQPARRGHHCHGAHPAGRAAGPRLAATASPRWRNGRPARAARR